MRFRCIPLTTVLIAGLWTGIAQAAGTLVPIGATDQPIQILDHDVSVVINNAARTEVTQTFFNPNPVDLEAIYAFPVPKRLSEATVFIGELCVNFRSLLLVTEQTERSWYKWVCQVLVQVGRPSEPAQASHVVAVRGFASRLSAPPAPDHGSNLGLVTKPADPDPRSRRICRHQQRCKNRGHADVLQSQSRRPGGDLRLPGAEEPLGGNPLHWRALRELSKFAARPDPLHAFLR